MHCRRNNFTLIEIMAVITIFMVVSAVAAVRLREDRTPARVEQTLLEFRRFSARLRNFAMQNDCEVIVFLDPETNEITAEATNSYGENAPQSNARGAIASADDVDASEKPFFVILDVKEYEEAPELGEAEPAKLAEIERSWIFPKKLEPEIKAVGIEELNLGEKLELWRFGRSGDAVLHSPLVVTFKEKFTRSVTVSEFSGAIIVQKGDVTEESDEA